MRDVIKRFRGNGQITSYALRSLDHELNSEFSSDSFSVHFSVPFSSFFHPPFSSSSFFYFIHSPLIPSLSLRSHRHPFGAIRPLIIRYRIPRIAGVTSPFQTHILSPPSFFSFSISFSSLTQQCLKHSARSLKCSIVR